MRGGGSGEGERRHGWFVILAAVRGAAGAGPELQALSEHITPYINERLQRLLEDDDGRDV